MKKRMLSALLALCMVLTMVPAAFAAENTELTDYTAVPEDRMSTVVVNGVGSKVEEGKVSFTVNSKANTDDWDQTSGTGSIAEYTYVGLYVDIPEGATSLKINDEGNPNKMTNVDKAFLSEGKFQHWFPVANKVDNNYSLFYGGREYTLLLEWYSSDSQDTPIGKEYVTVTRDLADSLAVAKVGNYTYETLADAVNAVTEENNTIELLQNVTLDATSVENAQGGAVLEINKSLTIDGNGKTIYGTGFESKDKLSLINIVGQNTDVTLKNVTIDGQKTTSGETEVGPRHGLNIWNAGTVTLDESVTITGNCWYAVMNNGSDLVVNDLTTFGNAWGINLDNGGTATINNANIVENSSIVYENTGTEMQNGSLTVNDGTYKNIVVKAASNENSTGTIALTGGSFNGVTTEESGMVNDVVTITGGSFTKTSDGGVDDDANYADIGELLDDGCKLDSEGAVVPADDSEASIGSKGYTTLEEAIAAVQPSDTITLLQNAEILDYVTLSVDNVVLNGNDKTLTCDATGQHGAIDVTADNVTIQNIKINSEKNYGVQFYNVTGGKLSNVDITGGAYTSVFVNASGDITIEDSTLNPTANPYYAAIEYGMGSAEGLQLPGKLTIDNVSGNNPITIWTDKDSTNAMISKSDSGYTADNVADKISQNIVNENSGSITINVAVEKDGETSTETTTKPGTGSSSSGGGSTTYSISIPSSVTGGDISVSPSRASYNQTVTITVNPDDGYELDKLTVTDADGDEISLTNAGDGKYTFKMPRSKVTISATFTEVEDVPEQVGPFTDVDTDAWFAEAVQYMLDNEMMNGTSATAFGPDTTTTRGMIVTILHRLEGEPDAAASSFTDVASSMYYADAINWAAANGIVNGISNTAFGPDQSITREQMAAILYRYAQFKGYDVTASNDLSSYTDASQISEYAATAMQWANAEELITGRTSTTLAPQGTATRAEVATILMRFCENIAA